MQTSPSSKMLALSFGVVIYRFVACSSIRWFFRRKDRLDAQSLLRLRREALVSIRRTLVRDSSQIRCYRSPSSGIAMSPHSSRSRRLVLRQRQRQAPRPHVLLLQPPLLMTVGLGPGRACPMSGGRWALAFVYLHIRFGARTQRNAGVAVVV